LSLLCTWTFCGLFLYALTGCKRVERIENPAASSVAMTREQARSVLGPRLSNLPGGLRLREVRVTTYDLYHRGGLSVPTKFVLSVLTFPVYFFTAPLLGVRDGVREVAELEFQDGRVYQREFRRRYLWFFAIESSRAARFARAAIRLWGTAEKGSREEAKEKSPESGT